MSCSTDRLEPTRTVWRRSARWSVAWASARGPVATLARRRTRVLRRATCRRSPGRRPGEAYLAFANREPALFRLMFGRGGRFKSDERLSEAARAAFLTLVEVVVTVRNQPPESPEVFKAAIAAWSVVHGYATLGLEGYLQALPAAHRPSARGGGQARRQRRRVTGRAASHDSGDSTRCRAMHSHAKPASQSTFTDTDFEDKLHHI